MSAPLHQRLLVLAETPARGPDTRRLNALMAAIKLHKPEMFGGHLACLACSPGMPPPVLVLAEDCATLQAIAHELGVQV